MVWSIYIITDMQLSWHIIDSQFVEKKAPWQFYGCKYNAHGDHWQTLS